MALGARPRHAVSRTRAPRAATQFSRALTHARPPAPARFPQELDLGGDQELWNLGPWLLRLRALRRLAVPRRSAQQGVFEALALRNDPHQVEVVEDGPAADDDEDAGAWGMADAEDWGAEGL